MNQHDQMREALREIHEEARDRYRNKDGVSPMWILERTQFALHAAEPAPLVRLTDDECKVIWAHQNKLVSPVAYAHAIMDAMQEKNK